MARCTTIWMVDARSIRKKEIIKTIKELGDLEALKIFRAYLGYIELNREEEFLVNLIKSRIDEMKNWF